MNYVFYDFETTGRSGTWDQIIQVGAVLVNAEFQELDRFEAKCGLKSGLVPEPGALLVNKTTPDMFIGYNSIGFDEEFLRKTLFKTLNDPYLTQFDGNKRGDILGLARTAHLYYPECIKTPTSDKGNAVFKLDELAPMNGIEHGNAHDAIGDVLATIGIAKIIADKAPAVWKASLMTTSKAEVNTIVENEKLFCFNEYFYGKARPYVVTFLCFHPKYNWPQCFDLKEDPQTYFEMSMEDLKTAMKKSPKIIRSVKNNKHPVIMNPKFGENFDGSKQLGMKKLVERAEFLRSNEEFKKKVSRILEDEAQEKEDLDSQLDVQAEESIYSGGFASDGDRNTMQEFHKSDWKDRLLIADKFKDSRFNYFAKRLIYEENPSILPKDIYNEIHRAIAKQILSTNQEKWNTIPKAYSELDTLRVKYEEENDQERLAMMNDLNLFLEEIEKKYQDA